MAGALRINIWFSVPVPKIKFDPPPQGKVGVIKINIWFSVAIPKIKFDPHPQGKNALVLIFEDFH